MGGEITYHSPMRRLPLAVVPALFAVACGGAPPPPAADVALPPASATAAPPPSTAAVVAAPSRRSPPDALLRFWAFDTRPRLVLYADLGGLLHTDLGRTIIPSVIALSQGSISPDQATCLRGASESAKDLVAGADDHDGLVVARFDDTAFDPAPCLKAAGALAVQLDGGKQALVLHRTYVVHEPGLLVIGSEGRVKQAMGPRAGASSFPHALTLGADEYLAWSAHVDEDVHLHGTLLASSERFRIAVEGDVPSFIAGQVEDQVKKAQARGAVPGLEGEEGAMAARLLQSVQITRDGSHLSAAFDLHEPPEGQARDLGMISALATAGVRKYLANAKSAEARNAVGQIAKDYVAWWEKEDGKPRSRRKLVSFPPVPKTIRAARSTSRRRPTGRRGRRSASRWTRRSSTSTRCAPRRTGAAPTSSRAGTSTATASPRSSGCSCASTARTTRSSWPRGSTRRTRRSRPAGAGGD